MFNSPPSPAQQEPLTAFPGRQVCQGQGLQQLRVRFLTARVHKGIQQAGLQQHLLWHKTAAVASAEGNGSGATSEDRMGGVLWEQQVHCTPMEGTRRLCKQHVGNTHQHLFGPGEQHTRTQKVAGTVWLVQMWHQLLHLSAHKHFSRLLSLNFHIHGQIHNVEEAGGGNLSRVHPAALIL